MDEKLGVGTCFDMTGRELVIGGRAARLWVVNGYAQEDILERIIAGWLALGTLKGMTEMADFCRRYVSACDARTTDDRGQAVMAVFAGKTLVVIEGLSGGLLMDVKQFPTRSVEEPDTSRVLRGSHDGFVENLMQNAALLRRSLRENENGAAVFASAEDVENALSVGEINALVSRYALLDGAGNPSCEDERERVEALKKAWSTRPTSG